MQRKLLKNTSLVLWLIFFCYATFAALLFQKLLLTLVPSLHASGGLLPNDAAYFDSVAWELAEKIRLYGWENWKLFPSTASSGNVAIVSALYAVFGHDPSLVIPINAAMHALGGLLIFLLARELADNSSVGNSAGFFAATLFIIYPTSLSWYGQNLKDVYAIAGTLLVLLTWVKAVRGPSGIRDWLLLIIGKFIGILLIASVRPYGLRVLLVATFGMWLAVILTAALRHQTRHFLKLTLFFLAAIITLAGGIKAFSDGGIIAGSEGGPPHLGETYKNWQSNGEWQWRNATWLPDSIENYIEIASRTRAGLIEYGLSERAKSMIDEDIAPQSIGEVVVYLPRALQVATLAPFPLFWLENFSITRLISAGEMLIYYLCIPGIFLLLLYNRKPTVFTTIYFACFFLLVLGFTTANMGTLYRLRYAYLFVLLMLGVLGWFTWLDKTERLKRLFDFLNTSQMPIVDELQKTLQIPIRKKVIGEGFLVMGLTFLYFLGFFLRDIMMARTFGLGEALDSFFIALLIPMFIVSVLCIPLGAAFTPYYLELKERFSPQVLRARISSISFWVTACLFFTCLFVYLSGPLLLSLLPFSYQILDKGHLVLLLNSALLLLLFSGVVILGNSILNANGRAVLAGSIQLIVPIFAILALILFGERHGLIVVMFGMIAGLLLNLIIVQFYLKRVDTNLLPSPGLISKPEFSPLMNQYLPLAISAFFVSAAAPMATILAMSLPESAVSAFNLGNKMVLFVTGLMSAAITAVILPYFSSMVAKNYLITARRELSFFLLFATFISIPISTGLYVWAEPIVRLMFEGNAFDRNATELVARVMQYSVVQIPFFVCNMLLLKFAIAIKLVRAISVVALTGLVINLCFSIGLMPHMGVAGIALGASISMVASTNFLVMVLVRYRHISLFDAVIMILNWLLFVTLLICVHFQSIPSAYVALIAYGVLLACYFSSFTYNKNYQLGG